MHFSYKGSKYNNTNHAYCSIYTIRGYTCGAMCQGRLDVNVNIELSVKTLIPVHL